jgi:hypothetical protein
MLMMMIMMMMLMMIMIMMMIMMMMIERGSMVRRRRRRRRRTVGAQRTCTWAPVSSRSTSENDATCAHAHIAEEGADADERWQVNRNTFVMIAD